LSHFSQHALEFLVAMIRALSFLGSLSVCATIGMACMPTPSLSLDEKKAANAKPADAKAPQTELQQFCANNAAIIGDARIGWQTSRLLELEAQIRQRIAELDAKKAEYVAWLRKRDEALKQATESVVAIYARMRPETAALQLAAMDDAMAAAILVKLSSRVAGALLNEMEVGRAARLTRMMAGPDATPDGKKS
jgi:flagellar motility protein MotE (MotC chaperone)